MRITAWLPIFFILWLASLPACARPIHIVAFGDSLTSGWLLPPSQTYPAQLQARLRAQGHDVTVKNAGIAGDTAKNALRRFDQAIDPGTDICIVEFGLNDRSRGASLKTVRKRVAELVHTLRARGIAVLVLGPGCLRFADLAAAQDALSLDFTLPPHRYRARDGVPFNVEGYAILVGRMIPQVDMLLRRANTR